MTITPLSEEQESELHRLWQFYRKEARRCAKAKAHLGACVMKGAELETALILMASAYTDEAAAVVSSRIAKKPLVNWTLNELLQVAKTAGWLPAQLNLDEDWDQLKANIGDYAEVVRKMRNLLHPSRYMKDQYRGKITKKYAKMAFEIIDVAYDHLDAHVNESLRKHFQAQKRSKKRKS